MKNLVQEIPIENIKVTGLNDRTVFDAQSQKDLADSVRKHGILQNLIVRKNGKEGSFELVAGERRLIAAKAAGLKTVPCNVKELNDTEFKEMMLIENLQRENIHPLDEAFGYKRLVDEKKPLKDISLKIGKPVQLIKKRLALTNLCDQGQNLFRDNIMQLGHAQILCMFTEQQQMDAIGNVMRGEKGFSYFDHHIDLKAWMNQHILQKLSGAIFGLDDEKLLKAAGKCSSCQKQTGFNTELFACVTAEAQCMDRECFEKKTNRHIELQNKKLLKQFNLKRDDCPTLTRNSYSYNGELSSDKWAEVADASECLHTTVGFVSSYNFPEMAIIACVNKKCKEHFDQPSNPTKSDIPENESKSENFDRRMKNRREKQLREDTHAARKEFLEIAAASKEKGLVTFELVYLAQIMIGRSTERAFALAEKMGFVKEEGAWFWQEDFAKFLATKGNEEIVSFIRTLMLGENLNGDDRYILSRNADDDNLLLHGKALNVEFSPILEEKTNARKEDHAKEDAELKLIKKKEKDRAKKIRQLISNADYDYPALHKIIVSKDRKNMLLRLELDELSKMAYRLGLKRKKDGDKDYYVAVILEGFEELLPKK